MTTAPKTPVERGAPSAFAFSSSEDDMGASSSSTASRSSKDNPRIVVMNRGKDSRLDTNDGDISSSSSSPPLSHCGTTTGRSRKKTTVPGKKSRPRTKMPDGHLLAQDHQRQLLKRSSSLPADVTCYADHLKLFYEELPDGPAYEKVDPDADICPIQSQVDGQQVHAPQSAVSDQGEDTQHIVDNLETAQNQPQPSDVMGQISGHSAKDQQDAVSDDPCPETGSLQSVVIDCPSSDSPRGESSDSRPCSDNGSKPSPDDADHQSSVANHTQPGHEEKQLSSEIGINNQHGSSFNHLSAKAVVVNKDMADSHYQESSVRNTSETDDALGLPCHKENSSDQNGSDLQDESNKSASILCLHDRESSSSGYQTTDTDRGPAKGSSASSSPSATISDSSALNSTPSASNSDPSAATSDPSASNSEGSHQDIYAEHSGDVSTSSSEDDKRAKETNRQSASMPFFLPSPYMNPQYPIFFVNNRGRGSFVHGPLREDYGTVPDFFAPQSNSTFLGCKLNRRPETQQGNFAYRHPGHANGQAYLPDMTGAQYDRQYSRPWTHNYNPRGRPYVVSSAYLRRGRGGLILRGRGGFRAGRGGGCGGRTRAGECRFPHYNTCRRRSRSRQGVNNNFPRRRMQDRNSRDRQEQLDRSGDWDSPNNGFARGRTPFRTNEAAYRHRSAPPAHSMRMANGMPYVRQRHRSLSRSGRHSDRPRNSPHPQADQLRWQYSPRVSRYQLNKDELYIPQQNYASPQQNYASPQRNYASPQQNYASPQQNYASPQQNYASPQQIYGPNVCRWSREMGLARPYHRQNRGGGDDYNRQGFRAGRHGHRGPTSGRAGLRQPGFYFDQEHPHSSNQTDCEPLSSEIGVSTERTEAENLDGQDGGQKTITVITQETGPQNGSQMPAQVEEQETETVANMGRQETDNDAFIHQHGSDTPGHSGQPGMPHGREEQYNARSLYGQWQKNRQAYRRKQRDGSNASYWRGTNGSVSPRYPGRQRAFQWEPQSPKYFQQRICRQRNGASEMHYPERYLDYERQGVNRAILSNGVNVNGWNHNSGEFPLCRSRGQMNMAGSPRFLAGDNLQIDFVRKVMHVLHDQHGGHAQSDQILHTLMKSHLPSEAGHSLTNIMRHLEATRAQTPDTQGRARLPCTGQENNSDKSRYLSNVRQQRKCRFDDGNQNNVSFELVTQANNYAGNYVHCAVSPPPVQRLQANTHDSLPDTFPNSPVQGYSQPGGFPANQRQFHTKENQQWRKSMRESPPQYVYYLDNQDMNAAARPDLQNESENQKQSWNYQNANQFSDVNANQQGFSAAGVFHQIPTQLQHSHGGQDNPRQSSADQAGGGGALGSARQARLVVHDGMNNYEALKPPQNLNHKPVMAMNEGQVNGAQNPSASPGFDKHGHQNALDKVNGNVGLEASMPDGRLQMPLVSNQPVQMGMGNFLPSVTPLQTPTMVPVQLQPVNTPLLQTVNTPMFHPLQTPFIQTMNVPYPQQNMFQFPSPLPYIPVGTPAQVCPAPNVFQFPDVAAGQQPSFPMEVNPAQQHDDQAQAAAAAEKRGFAGNQPLVQFPPNHTGALPSNPGHPHPLDNARRMGDANGND